MKILIIDTETTGLTAGKDAILEVGAALYSTGQRDVVWVYSTLLPDVDHNPIQEINGITDGMLKVAADTYARRPEWAAVDGPLAPILQLCDCGAVDVVAAHNVDFDRDFVDRLASNPPLLRGLEGRPLPWVCTEQTIRYPKQKRLSALRYLAVDHDVPFVRQQHRALPDVMLVAELLKLVPDLEDQIRNALKPHALFQAVVTYETNQLAKDRGFRFDWEARRWVKRLPRDTSLEATEDRPFRLQLIG